MVCKYCGEELPDNANVCEKCDHFTTRGTRRVFVGFVLIVLVVILVVGGIYIHKKVEEKKQMQEFVRQVNERMETIVDDYTKETDAIIQQMQEETEAIKQQQKEEK